MRIPNDNPLTTIAATTPGLPGGAATQIVAGTIKGFNPTTYEATVQIAGSGATHLAGLAVNLAIPVGAIRSGARCAIAFFRPGDPADACVLALFGRPPYRDDPDYFTLGSSALNCAVLCGSGLFSLDRDRLGEAVLGQ